MARSIRCAVAVLLIVGTCLSMNSANQAQSVTKAEGEAFVADYYYKAKWGYADEFIRLFKKNHYPVLKKQIETGRILSVTCVRPRFHATEEGRWDFRVTIVFKNMAAALDQASEEPIIKQLYPDQETFKREEQRRFEILLAHWDVPIVGVPLDK
jgi:TRAP-type mannitol/chloroaromatic compound transport system substrate-binding protein